MTVQAIISYIKNKIISPVYIFHGEEPYFIDQLSDYIEKYLLEESSKAFNQIIIYGKEADAKSIIDEAKQFPMMGERRLIIVKEAQELKNIQDLAPYVLKPVPHTVLVLCHKHKKIDKRYALGKALDKVQVVFESKTLYDNQLAGFISGYAKDIGLIVDAICSQMVADFLGNDLKKIANEMNKMLVNLGKGQKVTLEDIQEQIGISKEFNIFEYQNAIGVKDFDKVIKITKYFAENSKSVPIQVVISNLYNYFSKLYIASQNIRSSDPELVKLLGLSNSYFLKDYKIATKNYPSNKIQKILVYLSEMDLKSKGVNNRHSSDSPLYKDLSYFILNESN
jgi:DNA polymerase III subunit delta